MDAPVATGLRGGTSALSLERGVIYGLVGVIVIIVILVVLACLIWRVKNKSHGECDYSAVNVVYVFSTCTYFCFVWKLIQCVAHVYKQKIVIYIYLQY